MIGGFDVRFVFENGMYAAIAEPNMVIDYGDGYCDKLYRKTDDFSDCTEIEKPFVEEELTETEEKAAAYDVLMGVSE